MILNRSARLKNCIRILKNETMTQNQKILKTDALEQFLKHDENVQLLVSNSLLSNDENVQLSFNLQSNVQHEVSNTKMSNSY